MNKALRKATEYVREHILQFLSLAVILTLCLSLRYAALGKYVSYLQRSTQAVAGEFFFTSNYLTQGNPIVYTIPSWDRQEDNLALEIRGYSNSLKYNQLGTDFLYYVEADYFADEACTYKTGLEDFGITLTPHYGTAQLKEGSLDEYEYSKEVGYYTPDPDTPEKQYVVGLISGDNEFDSKEMTDQVFVHIKADAMVNKPLYIKVVAHSIPASEINAGKVSFFDNINRAGNSQGVFRSTINGIFKMGAESSDADVTDLISDNQSGYDVRVQLQCHALENQGVAQVRLFFDPNVVNFAQGQDTDAKDVTEDVKDSSVPAENTKYVEVFLNSGSSKTYYFLKANKSGFSSDDIVTVIVKEKAAE